VDVVVESIDFSEIEKKYQGPEHPAYNLRIMSDGKLRFKEKEQA